MSEPEEDEDVSPRPIDILISLLQQESYSGQNTSFPVDLSQPFIRSSLVYVYPFFIFLHACVSLVGTGGNCAILFIIIKRRLYKNPTFFFLGNLALSDLIKAAVVAPITLANLLIQNFIFGSFMCFFLPMMDSFPIHASLLTYLMIAADRYRFIVHPMKSRFPSGLCVIAVWVISVCVVLPYAVFIKYIDLRPFGAKMGLCMIDHDRHIEEYIRAMFVIFYCLPLAVIIFFYVKVSAEVKCQDATSMALHIEENAQSVSESTYQTHMTWTSAENDARLEQEMPSGASTTRAKSIESRRQSDEEEDLDTTKKKKVPTATLR